MSHLYTVSEKNAAILRRNIELRLRTRLNQHIKISEIDIWFIQWQSNSTIIMVTTVCARQVVPFT